MTKLEWKRKRMIWLRKSRNGKIVLIISNKKETSFTIKSSNQKGRINFWSLLLVDFKLKWINPNLLFQELIQRKWNCLLMRRTTRQLGIHFLLKASSLYICHNRQKLTLMQARLKVLRPTTKSLIWVNSKTVRKYRTLKLIQALLELINPTWQLEQQVFSFQIHWCNLSHLLGLKPEAQQVDTDVFQVRT